ncbi:choice-of-anchor Q domain-containing protein [Cellulomonas sp. NPDC089187]|uniref:choice-of-anchor Q domain-containing protein n=1 Tax=Cellulomonas sp. NPDC089187 TaxID=3154970 RepID=UPI00343004AB
MTPVPARRLTAGLATAVLGLGCLSAVALDATPAFAATPNAGPVPVTAAAAIPAVRTAIPVGATVTTGDDAGPGSLREAVAATQGTGLAISIDPGVPVLTLSSPLVADGDITLIGAGSSLTTLTGTVDLGLSVTAGSALTVSGLTLGDIGLGYTAASSVHLTDVTYRVAEGSYHSASFESISGDVVLDGVVIPDTVSLTVSQLGGDLIIRNSTLSPSLVYGYRFDGDIVIEDTTLSAAADSNAAVWLEDISGNVRIAGVRQTGPAGMSFFRVNGNVAISDVTVENDSQGVARGPVLGEIAGSVTVDRLHVSGLFMEGLAVNGISAGAAAQTLSITDSSFVAPPSESGIRSSGIVTNFFGLGGVEMRGIRAEGTAVGISVVGLGRNDEGLPAGPAVFEDISITGSRSDSYTTGLLVDDAFGDVTVRTSTITEVSSPVIVSGTPTEGSRLSVTDSVLSTVDGPQGLSALNVRSAAFAETTVSGSHLSGSGESTLSIDNAGYSRTGIDGSVLIENTTVALGSSVEWASAAAIELATDADSTVVNTTVVAREPSDAALISHRSSNAGPLSVAYTTVVGGNAVSSETTGEVTIDASVLDGTGLITTSPNAHVTRSALTGEVGDLTGVTVDDATLGGVDPTLALGPLQDNGGATPTMAPLPGSPLIDSAGARTEVTTDQRGVARPASSTDIGAVEIEPGTVTITPEVTVDGGTTAVLTLTRTGADTDTYPLDVALTAPDGTAVLGTHYLSPTETITFPAGVTTIEIAIDTLAVTDGADTWFTVRATTPSGQSADGTVTIHQAASTGGEGPSVIDPPASGEGPDPVDPPQNQTPAPTPAPTPEDETASAEPAVRSGVLAVTGRTVLPLALGALALTALGGALLRLRARRSTH